MWLCPIATTRVVAQNTSGLFGSVGSSPRISKHQRIYLNSTSFQNALGHTNLANEKQQIAQEIVRDGEALRMFHGPACFRSAVTARAPLTRSCEALYTDG